MASAPGGIAFEDKDVLRVERVLLKDNTADLLRDYIVSGRVEPGAKLVERQLSAALGVSRMPIRDALMKLEQEGLVVSRSAGRFVIEISESEARQLTQVRSPLEFLAVDLAASSIEAEDIVALKAALSRMKSACRLRDRASFVSADVQIHALIWKASKNKYLQSTLTTILGPLLVVISNSVEAFDWAETLAIHDDLVGGIINREREASRAAIHRHMESITR